IVSKRRIALRESALRARTRRPRYGRNIRIQTAVRFNRRCRLKRWWIDGEKAPTPHWYHDARCACDERERQIRKSNGGMPMTSSQAVVGRLMVGVVEV